MPSLGDATRTASFANAQYQEPYGELGSLEKKTYGYQERDEVKRLAFREEIAMYSGSQLSEVQEPHPQPPPRKR